MSEGMGSVIPIKVAEGRSFSEKLKMWDTGESCPAMERSTGPSPCMLRHKKVMAPQICKNSETSPPINPRENASKATREMCKMKNLPSFLIRTVPFRLIFLGLVEGGASFMDEKRSYTVKELQEKQQVSRQAVYELLKQKQFEWVVV